MNHSNVLRLATVLLVAALWTFSPICGAVHTSIFKTVELCLKQPQGAESTMRLISIAADGLVTIGYGDTSIYTARVGEAFRDARGRPCITQHTLISVNAALDTAGIRYETRSYLLPKGFRPGFIESPYAPGGGYIDVRAIPAGSKVRYPYTGRTFRLR